MPSNSRLPFHAAKFSLWAPLVAISVNMACIGSLSALDMQPVFAVSMLLYVLGGCVGVAALCGMRKHGADRILVRGVLGVGLNVAFFVLTLQLTYTMMPGSVRAGAPAP